MRLLAPPTSATSMPWPPSIGRTPPGSNSTELVSRSDSTSADGADSICFATTNNACSALFCKARHRDPARSTHSYTTWRYGHKWVVLCVLVRFPWALPVLVTLYLSRESNRQQQRRRRTPTQLMALMLRVMLRWFPDRTFVFVGDSSYGTHEMARLVHRHRHRLNLVSKLHPDANLYAPPPQRRGKGRRLAKPRVAACRSRRWRLTVGWYGGGTRRVEIVTGTGAWYKAGHGLVPLRWVFVRDRDGTHRDEYFFITDPLSLPKPSSVTTPPVGPSKRRSKNSAVIWVWKRREVGAGKLSCGPHLAYLGFTQRSPCCSTTYHHRNVVLESVGPARLV
jgi:hypothetical protein